jgi:CelD/BcsL family acetyltransferase involved in cellulose biosynthesis
MNPLQRLRDPSSLLWDASHSDDSASTDQGVRIEWLTSIDDLDRLRDEWDGFVEQTGGDIYFTVDWLQAWWTHYGHGRTFHGLAMWRGARMVAALPFCVHRVWAGPVPVRLARFVGADSSLPVFTPAVAEGFEEMAVRAALERLLDDLGCDAASLSPLSGLSRVTEAAGRVAAGSEFRLLRSDDNGVHTLFNLPASYEDYVASLHKSQRHLLRRNLRKLQSDYDITTRTVSGEEAITYLDRFVQLHTTQWRAHGQLGHFGDWPSGVAFNRDLVSRMAASGRARFYELAGDGDVLAIHYCFVLGERCFGRLPARDPDPALEKLGLGRLSLAETFRVLMQDGQRFLEGGPGHYDYKLRLGAEEHPMHRVVFGGRTRSRRWRGELLLRWASLVHLVYYRAWFLKLRPRLGLPPRPLWRNWTRTRI